jgi:hypothetical protein
MAESRRGLLPLLLLYVYRDEEEEVLVLAPPVALACVVRERCCDE